MSYCRWSSMDFQCDLYCYSDVMGGWTTHVAGSRRVGDIVPSPGLVLPENWNALSKEDQERLGEEWARQYNLHLESVNACALVDIGLPSDGETFRDATIGEFRDRLLSLRAQGYIFPDRVLKNVEEEIAEHGEDWEDNDDGIEEEFQR